MKYITTTFDIEKGQVQIPLGQRCNCHVGLVEITLPSFNERQYVENSIDITCDQIDSTIYNPKRLLRRINFEKVAKGLYYHYAPTHIIMEKVDSDDDFLTIKIARTNSFRSSHAILLSDKARGHEKVYITLAIQKENTPRCI